MHTRLFLEPGHFHATLTLREASPRVSDDVFVSTGARGEPREFLALIDRFNRRRERPARLAERTLAKHTLLAAATTRTSCPPTG